MHIIAVLANGKTELAGSGISSFVGFFSEIFREHDYQVGRTKAREYLLREDVSRLLGLDTNKLQQEYDANPLLPMIPALKLPLSAANVLGAGGRWIAYAVWIRLWKVAVAMLLAAFLMGFLLFARSHGWF